MGAVVTTALSCGWAEPLQGIAFLATGPDGGLRKGCLEAFGESFDGESLTGKMAQQQQGYAAGLGF